MPKDEITPVAQRIIKSSIEPFFLRSQRVSIGVSIEIMIYPFDDHKIDDLLRHADIAIYRAKQQGENSFQYHLPNYASSTLSSKPS